MSSRQKSKSGTDIPLLPKALEIMAKYNNDPDCIKRGRVLPGRSNQKMKEYLKEIADLCEISETLNTHKARRTFASTVALNNGVSIHIVKEMLGHSAVKQTEEYAITEQAAIGREMKNLNDKLNNTKNKSTNNINMLLAGLQKEMEKLKGTESCLFNENSQSNFKLLDFLLSVTQGIGGSLNE